MRKPIALAITTYPGDCKHIVALLLTYCHEPELFDEVTPVQDKLAEHSKEELIALIRQMVDRYPDLAVLVDRPIPRPTAKGEKAAPLMLLPFNANSAKGSIITTMVSARRMQCNQLLRSPATSPT